MHMNGLRIRQIAGKKIYPESLLFTNGLRSHYSMKSCNLFVIALLAIVVAALTLLGEFEYSESKWRSCF